MVDAFNTSQTIYAVISGWSNNIFGSIELTYLFIFIVLVALSFAFRIPPEFTILLIIPLLLVMAAFTASLLPLVYALLIFGGYLLYKFFLVRL